MSASFSSIDASRFLIFNDERTNLLNERQSRSPIRSQPNLGTRPSVDVEDEESFEGRNESADEGDQEGEGDGGEKAGESGFETDGYGSESCDCFFVRRRGGVYRLVVRWRGGRTDFG